MTDIKIVEQGFAVVNAAGVVQSQYGVVESVVRNVEGNYSVFLSKPYGVGLGGPNFPSRVNLSATVRGSIVGYVGLTWLTDSSFRVAIAQTGIGALDSDFEVRIGEVM